VKINEKEGVVRKVGGVGSDELLYNGRPAKRAKSDLSRETLLRDKPRERD
jgi:hypothetical protein